MTMIDQLSILLPVYGNDCTALVSELLRQCSLINTLTFEIIVMDDGSPMPAAENAAIAAMPHCRYIRRGKNGGRAVIRNALAKEARYSRLLFIDSDMAVEKDDFIVCYLRSPDDVTCGGVTIGRTCGEDHSLRYIYERKALSEHTARRRQVNPYAHFNTCNFMVKSSVMRAIPFDERFRRYGYEDTLLGRRLYENGVVISHIDNPVAFREFDDNALFMEKTEEGLRTLHRFHNDLRGYSGLLALAEKAERMGIAPLIRGCYRLLGSYLRRNLTGDNPRLSLFKPYKLLYYFTL